MTTATRVPLDFTLTNQNFWGLGAAASIDQTATLASLTIPTISASRYGVAGTLSADAALTASIHGSSGSVSMDYPVDVNVATPTTVTPGSFLNIQTGLTDVGSVNVTTQSPYLTASLDFQASAAVAGSVGWGLLSHSFSANPSINKNLYTISSGDHAWNPSFAGISLNLSIPGSFNSQGTTLGSASNGLPSARAAGSAPFLSASADLVKLAEDLGAPIGPLSGSIDLGLGTSAHWDVLGADLTGTFSLVQQATFIPSAINVTLTPNFGAAQIKPLGQAFSFQVPSTWNQAVSISESYSLVGTLADVFGIQASADLDLSVLSGGFSVLGVPHQLGPLWEHDYSLGTSGILPIYTTQPISQTLTFSPGSSLTVPLSISPGSTPTGGTGFGTGAAPTPVVTVVASQTIATDGTIMLASLFSATEEPSGSSAAPQYYRFTLGSASTGQFVIGGRTLGSGAQATNADLASAYFLAGSSTGTGSIGIFAYDTSGTASSEADVALTITAPSTPITQPPTNSSGPSIQFTGYDPILQVGGTLQFSVATLWATESGTDPSQLTYTVDTSPGYGVISKSGVAVTSFTQADINNGLVTYAETGVPAAGDSFTYHVTDSAGQRTQSTTFNIDLIPNPDLPSSTHPTIVANTTLTVGKGSTVMLTDANLSVADSGVSSWQIHYTIESAPSHGSLVYGGGTTVLQSFTQQQLDDGLVYYRSDGTASGPDSFSFSVSDALGGSISPTAFAITIIPPNNLHVNSPSTVYLNSRGGLSPDAPFPSYVAKITPVVLSAVDSGVSDADITYTVTGMPATAEFDIGQWSDANFTGRIFDAQNLTGSYPHSFTQADVAAGDVFYVQHDGDGSQPYGVLESVALNASDSVGNSVSGVILPILPGPPGLLTNGQFISTDTIISQPEFNVGIGETTTIDSTILTYIYNPFVTDQIIYRVSNIPLHGTLALGGESLTKNSTFTQTDVDLGGLTYTQDGSAIASDPFGLYVLQPVSGNIIGILHVAPEMTGTNGGQVFADNGTPTTFYVGRGNNWVLGGTSGDTLSYANVPAGVVVNLATGTAQNGFGGTDTISNIYSVVGSAHDDTITGTSGDDTIASGPGDDTIDGGGGVNTAVFSGSRVLYNLSASGGAAVVSGPDGTDTLRNIQQLVFADGTVALPSGTVLAALAGFNDITGGGSLLVDNQATVVAGSQSLFAPYGLNIAGQAGAPGTVTVDGAGSALLNSGVFQVGAGAIDSLTIQNGGGVSTAPIANSGQDGAAIAVQPGSDGSQVIVSGTGSNWQVSGRLQVGEAAAGALSVSAGGVVNADQLVAGGEAGGAGAITLTGAGSRLTVAGLATLGDAASASRTFVVGDAGLGSLSIQAGGTVITTPGTVAGFAGAVIGAQSGAAGSSVNVTGAGSNWQIGGALEVGAAAAASLAVTAGGQVSAASLDAGVATGAAGIVSVVGNASAVTLTGQLTVGDAALAELSILSGGTVSANNGDIGLGAGSTGNVDIEGTGSQLNIANNLNIGDAGVGVLTLGNNTELTVVNNLNIGANGVLNQFGGLIDPSVVNNTGRAGGKGAIIATVSIVNTGTLFAASGTETLVAPVITGTGVLEIDTNGNLTVNAGSVASTQTVTFTDGTGILTIGTLGGFGATIGDFITGDAIIVQGTSIASDSFDASTHVLTLFDASSATIGTLQFGGSVTGTNLGVNGTGGIGTAPCFVAGTRISTERDEVAVEDLRVGDRVQVVLGAHTPSLPGPHPNPPPLRGRGGSTPTPPLPRSGGGLGWGPGVAQPVIWIGHRHVDCSRHPEPRKVWPVRVSAGALGPGRPCRDLFLSPDHAVYVADVLIPVKHLINGDAIAQVPRDTVTYYHVELPAHGVLLAEGLPAESYLDTGDRTNFANGGGPIALHPDFASRVWEAAGCAPLVVTGPVLDATRRWVNALSAAVPRAA